MELKVNQFILKRLIDFRISKDHKMEFRGIDWRGVPFTFFKSVTVKFDKNGPSQILKGEPYVISFKDQKAAYVSIEFYRFLK